MTEETENLVLELLRVLRAGQDQMRVELRSMDQRLTAVETVLTGLAQRFDAFQTINDEFRGRFERIEQQLKGLQNP